MDTRLGSPTVFKSGSTQCTEPTQPTSGSADGIVVAGMNIILPDLADARLATTNGVWGYGVFDYPIILDLLDAAGASRGIYNMNWDSVPFGYATGRGAFEGVQADDRGNLYLVEDSGGKTGAPVPSTDPSFSTFPNAFTKQPNSFVYRFVPNDPSDLTKGGKMQVLQVLVNGSPVTFTKPASSSAADVADAANTDISGSNSAGYKAIHVYGASYETKWITINTTTSSTPLPGADDNALAKTMGGIPFKRPENGVFRPGSKFTEFYFDETGDTDNRTCGGGGAAANPNWAACTSPNQTGGFGSIFKLVQSPTSDTGSISLVYDGDQVHAGFDNVAFFSRDDVAFVEDAGDTLHKQRNALDSAYMFDVSTDYSNPANQPTRFIAEGRDASATLDAGLADAGTPTTNEGDNEITGMFVSDGDPSNQGLLGKTIPKPFNRTASGASSGHNSTATTTPGS